jgi:hypothetical protein
MFLHRVGGTNRAPRLDQNGTLEPVNFDPNSTVNVDSRFAVVDAAGTLEPLNLDVNTTIDNFSDRPARIDVGGTLEPVNLDVNTTIDNFVDRPARVNPAGTLEPVNLDVNTTIDNFSDRPARIDAGGNLEPVNLTQPTTLGGQTIFTTDMIKFALASETDQASMYAFPPMGDMIWTTGVFQTSRPGLDVDLGAGTLTVSDVSAEGLYYIELTMSVERTVGGGNAVFGACLLLNGFPAGAFLKFSIANNNEITSTTFVGYIPLVLGNVLQIQFSNFDNSNQTLMIDHLATNMQRLLPP